MIDFGFDLAGRPEPRLARGAVVSALGALTEAAPLLVAYVVLDGIFNGSATWAWIGWCGAALAILLVANATLKTLGGIDNFIATYGLVCDARLRLTNHLRHLPMGYWSQQRTGAVSSLVTDEFALYTEIVTHAWSLVVVNLAKPIAIGVVLLIVDWRLGALAVATLPPALLAVPWSHRLLNRASERLAAARQRAHTRIVEYVQGVTTLREYDGAEAYLTSLRAELENLEWEQLRTELAPAPAIYAYKLAVWMGFAILVAVGAWGVSTGHIEPTRFLLAALLALQLYSAAGDLSDQLALARFASGTLERIRRLFQEPAQLDRPDAVPPDDSTVRFEQVSFSYADRPVVNNITAELRPGTVTALVGPSGSGKSTLAQLVYRLWDTGQGRITIGGVDVQEFPLAELQRRVGAVLQDVVLFAQTVRDNISLGRPDATEHEIIAAAKAARAHDFIMTLHAGYDTVLTEDGGTLSGGQRQRLSIARALLVDAPILVLDEATSSIDSHNERLVQEAIAELTRGRTVLVIAHRLWTIQHADQILVLDSGNLVQRGSHTELMAAGGLYRRLWDAQQTARGWRVRAGGVPRDE